MLTLFFYLQMNANNQTSTSLKQIKLQMPIFALETFASSIKELYKMYPFRDTNLANIAEEEED